MGGALNKVVFQPPVPSYGFTPSIWLTTKYGCTVPAFFVDRGARFTLLFAHGNAEDLGMIYSYFEQVSVIWNVNVFAFEYSGYGLSTGEASEKNVYADAEAAYTYLVDVLGKKWETIILYGRSLGSGACVHLATKVPVRGVILQSPLLSIHRVGLKLRCTLPGDMFANVDKIKNVKCPVFIIHGTNDEMIPVYHGRALYDSCKTAVYPYWVEGGGHNDIEVCAKQTFFENVARFLQFLDSDVVSRSLGCFQHMEKQNKLSAWRQWFRFMVCSENRALADVRRANSLTSPFPGPTRSIDNQIDSGVARLSAQSVSTLSQPNCFDPPPPGLQQFPPPKMRGGSPNQQYKHGSPSAQYQQFPPMNITEENHHTPHTQVNGSPTTPFTQATYTVSTPQTQRAHNSQPLWTQLPRNPHPQTKQFPVQLTQKHSLPQPFTSPTYIPPAAQTDTAMRTLPP
eukprot:Selendium_serpulae@DN6312_c0_g1_i1.p1